MANNVTITGIKAGTTTITASYTDGGVTKTSSVNFTVSKATGYLTATTANKTYNGSSQTIASIATNSGTYYFGLGSSTTSGPSSWGTANTALQATNAGTYYVWAKCDTSTNYNAVTAKYIGTATISQRTVTVTAPTVQSNTIKYNGSAQALLSGNGSVSAGGTMYYYCSTSSTAPTTFSTSTWSTTAPSKTDVGTYYIWYYAYVSDTSNNTGTNINTIKSLGSKAIEKRIGTAPTFSASSVTAKCAQGSSASTSNASNAGAFTAATAGHSGSITYVIQSVVLNGSSTTLSGWTMTSTTSRIITVPANTLPGTYKVTVRATEAATTTDTSSNTDAVITVTLSKGDQTLNLDKTTLSLTVPNTGTITASGYVGTLTVTSGTPAVATASNTAASTITAVGSGNASNNTGTSTITFTAAATNYLNSVSKTATVTVTRRTGAAPTFNNSTVTATCSQDQTAKTTSAFTAGSAGHSGTLSYSLVSAKNSGGTSLTGWSVTSSNRTIGIPANTVAGTYTVVVRCTEAATTADTASTKDATITVTLSKGTQSLTLTSNPSNKTITFPNTGTITASGHVGTISASSGTTSVATVSVSGSVVTVTSKGYGTSAIRVTAGATDYVNSTYTDVTWTVNRRTGAAPTFNDSTASATLVQAGSARTTSAFTAATAGHSGTLSYALVDVKKSGSSTSLTGWSVNSGDRTIGVPANTAYGTYLVTVRCNEAQNSTDSASSKDATVTVTLNRGTQSLTLTSNPSNSTLTFPGTGTVTASGYSGTLQNITSSNTAVATVSTSGSVVTVTSVGNGTTTISVTAGATDYVGAVTKTVTWTVNRRTGAAPTFNDASVSATLVQAGSARTTSAFTAATAGHSGSITYSLGTVTKSGSSTSLTGWTIDSTNRKINVPANTAYGTYYATVTANEAQTSTDTASSKSATITITLNRGTQTLTLDKDTLTLTVGGSTGTITASSYSGTLTVTSGTPAVATASNATASTITAVSGGTATITFTAAATNYVESVSKTATVTVNKREGAQPTFNASTVTATCSQDQSAKTTSAFTAATAGHSGSLSYSIVSVTNSGGTTLTGWSINGTNGTSRTINIPANTVAGTYTVVVKASEAATSTDTASEKNATITVTLSKGTQSLTLTGNPSNYTSTYSSGGTITASDYAGTISATSGTTGVATVSVSGSVVTVTCVKAGTSGSLKSNLFSLPSSSTSFSLKR